MSNLKEILQIAIQAIEHPWNESTAVMPESAIKTINLCKSALSDIEKCYGGTTPVSDPVGYLLTSPEGAEIFVRQPFVIYNNYKAIPLYTSPISKECEREGWVSVPIEPYSLMLNQGADRLRELQNSLSKTRSLQEIVMLVYEAMLSAAPKE